VPGPQRRREGEADQRGAAARQELVTTCCTVSTRTAPPQGTHRARPMRAQRSRR
jgi:hypothetical protein